MLQTLSPTSSSPPRCVILALSGGSLWTGYIINAESLVGCRGGSWFVLGATFPPQHLFGFAGGPSEDSKYFRACVDGVSHEFMSSWLQDCLRIALAAALVNWTRAQRAMSSKGWVCGLLV